MAEEYLTDDEQLEAVKRWAVENGPWLIGGVVLGAVLFFGYRYYERHNTERALQAAAQFNELTTAMQSNDQAKSRRLAEILIKDYSGSPYADQAQLSIARLDVDSGQLAGAVAPLTEVMNNSKDTELRQIAKLRLARLLIDQGKPDEALNLLAKDTAGSFAGRYHEVRGDAFLAKKDPADAGTEYQAALASADTAGVSASLLELKVADLGTSAKIADASPVIMNKAHP